MALTSYLANSQFTPGNLFVAWTNLSRNKNSYTWKGVGDKI